MANAKVHEMVPRTARHASKSLTLKTALYGLLLFGFGALVLFDSKFGQKEGRVGEDR